MTAYRGLYVKGTSATPSVGTTPLEARLVAAGHIAEQSPGVPRQGLLFQSATNLVTATATTAPMSYNIAACVAAINRVAGEGVYEMSLVGTTVANTVAAPSANSRWDLIYIKQNDVEKGDADNGPVVGVVNGTAAATPTKPYASVPPGAYVLAEAQIFSGTTTTAASPNTIAQVWLHTAIRGTAIPIISANDLASLTPFTGLRVTRLDQAGLGYVYAGGAWHSTDVIADLGGVNGNNVPIVKSGWAMVNTDGSGYAGLSFNTPFPHALVNAVITEATAPNYYGAIIPKWSYEGSDTGRLRMYLYPGTGPALANITGVRVSYVAFGY